MKCEFHDAELTAAERADPLRRIYYCSCSEIVEALREENQRLQDRVEALEAKQRALAYSMNYGSV